MITIRGKPVVVLNEMVLRAWAKHLGVPYSEEIETQDYVYIKSQPIPLKEENND